MTSTNPEAPGAGYTGAALVTDVRALLASRGILMSNLDDYQYARALRVADLLVKVMQVRPSGPHLRLVPGSPHPLPGRADAIYDTIPTRYPSVARMAAGRPRG